jgi:hypothetical protein
MDSPVVATNPEETRPKSTFKRAHPIDDPTSPFAMWISETLTAA